MTVEIILEGASRVLAADGLAGFTTSKVADVAGVSVGSLYQYFPNKAAMIAALIERAQRAFATEVERMVAATTSLPLDEVLREFAVFAVRQQYEQPILAAALDEEELRLPVAPVLQEAEGRICDAVEAMVLRRGYSDAATVARDLFVITKALVEAHVGEREGPPTDLAARVQRALLGYLSLDGRSSAAAAAG